jgi:hypothetical protein
VSTPPRRGLRLRDDASPTASERWKRGAWEDAMGVHNLLFKRYGYVVGELRRAVGRTVDVGCGRGIDEEGRCEVGTMTGEGERGRGGREMREGWRRGKEERQRAWSVDVQGRESVVDEMYELDTVVDEEEEEEVDDVEDEMVEVVEEEDGKSRLVGRVPLVTGMTQPHFKTTHFYDMISQKDTAFRECSTCFRILTLDMRQCRNCHERGDTRYLNFQDSQLGEDDGMYHKWKDVVVRPLYRGYMDRLRKSRVECGYKPQMMG